MKFTVVFPTREATDWSVGLVFIPSPCWVVTDVDADPQGGAREPLVIISPQDPKYQVGGLDRLFQRLPLIRKQLLLDHPVTVVTHPTGHGEWDDLQNLILDLQHHGFTVNLAGSVTSHA